MINQVNFNLTKSTLKFSILGIFIAGLTMMFVVIAQMVLTQFIGNCESAWNLLFIFTTIGALIMPILFGKQAVQWDTEIVDYRRKLFGYNIIEYTFLQVSIGWLYSDSYTLCKVTDGQNGIQFVFSAWLGMILLIIYSFLLDLKINNNHK